MSFSNLFIGIGLFGLVLASPAPCPINVARSTPAITTTTSSVSATSLPYECNPAHSYNTYLTCILVSGTPKFSWYPTSTSTASTTPTTSTTTLYTTSSVPYNCNPAHQYPSGVVCSLISGTYQFSTLAPTLAPTPVPTPSASTVDQLNPLYETALVDFQALLAAVNLSPSSAASKAAFNVALADLHNISALVAPGATCTLDALPPYTNGPDATIGVQLAETVLQQLYADVQAGNAADAASNVCYTQRQLDMINGVVGA